MYIIKSTKGESGTVNGPAGMEYWDGGMWKRVPERARPFETKKEATDHAKDQGLKSYIVIADPIQRS